MEAIDAEVERRNVLAGEEDILRSSLKKAFDNFAEEQSRLRNVCPKLQEPVMNSYDLRVLVTVPGCSAERYLDSFCTRAFKDPAAFVRSVEELACELLPSTDIIQLAYIDSDGDACRLLEETVPDALCCARCIGRDTLRLLQVRASDPSTLAQHIPADVINLQAGMDDAPSNLPTRIDAPIQSLEDEVDRKDIIEMDSVLEPSFDPSHDIRILIRTKGCHFRIYDIASSAVFDEPAEVMQTVRSLAQELLVTSAFRATYIDDEEDECILSEASLPSALCLAKPAKSGCRMNLLEITVSELRKS